jgi:hypothetical protein
MPGWDRFEGSTATGGELGIWGELDHVGCGILVAFVETLILLYLFLWIVAGERLCFRLDSPAIGVEGRFGSDTKMDIIVSCRPYRLGPGN